MTCAARALVLWAVTVMTACPGEAGDSTATTTHTGADPTNQTGDVCEAPVAPTGPAVAVHLRNDSAVDVFMPASAHNGQGPPFELSDPDGNLQTIELAGCPGSCDDLLVDGTCACDPRYSASVLRIVPGGVYEGMWSGAYVMTLFTEEECVPAECSITCDYEVQAPAGDHTFAVYYGKGVECDTPGCTCEPSADGWCEIAGADFGLDEDPLKVVFTYPDTTDVTLSLR